MQASATLLTAFRSWVDRPNRPISLRQLFFYGRTLTESRLLSSANYVRMELPTRCVNLLVIYVRAHLVPDSPTGCETCSACPTSW